MSAISERRVVAEAKRKALAGLRNASDVRLVFTPGEDGWWQVTSPDLDWLYCISADQEGARMRALTAIMKVSRWAGASVRLPRRSV